MLAPMLRAGVLSVLLLCLAACGGVGQPAPYDSTGIDGLEIPSPSPDPADFVSDVDNAWFPLTDSTIWNYLIEEDGRPIGKMG